MPPIAEDLIVAGELLLDPARAPERGWLRLSGGKIVERGFGEAPRAGEPAPIGGAGAIVTPAFVDAHTHLPQTDSVGCDGMQLLDWLNKVIFPAEEWWGQGQHRSMARTAVRRMAREGTAGFAGYLTSHSEQAADVLHYLHTSTPMRFIAGRVAMDRKASGDLVREDRERVKMNPTPKPVLPALPGADPRTHAVSANPRFAVSCTPELLAEVGWCVRDVPGMWVQTHLAESHDELRTVEGLFPEAEDYTAVYEEAGLLGERTILAHCCHLGEREWRAIAAARSVIAHCPTANIFLSAGLFDLDAAREHGCRVALGSDVAAGSDVAMPRVARAMIETAKVRSLTGSPGVRVPTPAEAWRAITTDNARHLGWSDMGEFEVGNAATALVLRVPETWRDKHLVGRLIYNWSPLLITHRVFEGVLTDPDTL